MSNKHILYWSCNREKYVRISASGDYVERLGFALDTEWHLEIKPRLIESENIPSRLFNNNKRFLSGYFQDWSFDLRRTNKSGSINIMVKFFFNDTYMHYSNLKINSDQNALHIGYSSLSNSVSDFDLALIFENEIGSKSETKEKGLSKFENLSEDFQSMLDKGNRSDVTLKCDTEVIRAHKNVLGARSPVFEAMFNSNMEENEKDEVVIKDMDTQVLRALVCFIYSGQIKDLNFSFVRDLLYASEKYQISAMKEGCVEYLRSILSHDNAFEILEMGDLYDENLKANSAEYVCKHFNEMKTKEEWQIFKLKKPLLAVEIYSQLEPYIEKKH